MSGEDWGGVIASIILVALLVCLGFGIVSCAQSERATKCFKDTQDKQCWGIK